MENELEDWMRRLFLCLSFSSSADGFSRSMSFYSTTETTLMRIQSYKSNIETGNEQSLIWWDILTTVAGERRSLDRRSNREDGDWAGARLRESLLVGAAAAVRQAIERRGQSYGRGGCSVAS
jgi:hypothetical protein